MPITTRDSPGRQDHAGPEGIADFGPVQAARVKDSRGNLINLIQGTSPLWSR